MSEFVLAKVEIDETAATIAAGREFIGPAVEAIKAARLAVERQVRKDDFFLTTLEPYDPSADSPRTIRRMCDAARVAGVGPMAAVAGVIAQEALEAMMSRGLRHGWVENGGDIAIIAGEKVVVEVFSEPGSTDAVGLELEPSTDPLGICTSSGRLGHSISFGDADAAVAIARDAVLADALATAIGNGVTDEGSLASCFDRFKGLDGFRAGLVLRDDRVAVYGNLPRIVSVEHSPERVTVHSRMASPKHTGHRDGSTEVTT